MIVKMCGMCSLQDIDAALDCRPDYVGYIFAPGRRRTISADLAREMTKRLGGQLPAVGVFLDQEPEEILELLRTEIIQIAQLHGSESEEMIRFLQRESGRAVWKAFRIRQKEDLVAAKESSADLILLDAGTGEGKSFDWSLLSDFDRSFLLAGGLGPDNIRQAAAQVHPFGIDLSSGIETDRAKDPEKMKKVMEIVRSL
jgi:phosphoribosylanthranilate isomerase